MLRLLPEEGKPADFNGAVGRYSITARMDSKEVDTGDAAIYTVTIKGTGNLPVINAPAINWPRDMESYDVNSKENIDQTVAPLGGSKTFAYSFVATKPGKYSLPPVQMSYFDPASHSYKNTESGSVQIQVNQVKGTKKTGSRSDSHKNNSSGLDPLRTMVGCFPGDPDRDHVYI